ncbi:MAG: glycosyltransferase family 4 protein [Anaerolineales bacterium]
MKIAVIAQGSIPAQSANSIQNMKMAQALASLGNEVRIFAPGRDPNLPWEQISKHYGLEQRLAIQWVPSLAWLRRYDFALSSVNAARAWGADLIYTRLPQAAALASRRGVPAIFELHDLPTGTMGPWLIRRFIEGHGARRIIVNTRHLAEAIKARYALPADTSFLLVAPNGVDLQRYADLPDPEGARKSLGLADAFTAGYTGHLYAGRGAELILEMAKRLPEMNLLFVGGRKDDVQRMREKAHELKNVRIVGFVPQGEVPLYQAACDVLLMPYGRQVGSSSGADIAAFTNPLKMFEYLASGRSILASDLPILGEVLNEKNAIILPGEDLDAWVEALGGLQASPQRRAELSAAAKETAGLFSWEKRAALVLQASKIS